MNGKVANYSVEGAKYGISFGTASPLRSPTPTTIQCWAIIHGFFSWLCLIYYVLVK